MLRRCDLRRLKDKIGFFFSLSVINCEQPLELLEEKIICSDVFDFFETDKIEDFLELTFGEMYHAVFQSFNENKINGDNISSALYWVGAEYVSLSINKRIPLRQLFLIFPLRKMLAKYDAYHEMNEQTLLEDFDSWKKNNIFSYFKEKTNFSADDISFLSGINKNTIVSLSRDNHYLFNTSSSNQKILSELLNISPCFMKKESSFVFFDDIFFKDQRFVDAYTLNLRKYLNLDEKTKTVINLYSNPSGELRKEKQYLFIGNEVEYKNGNKFKNITQLENEFILEKTVIDLKNNGDMYF